VPASEFDWFRAELHALADALDRVEKKTLRDEVLRNRFRSLFRTWASTIEPNLQGYQRGKREVLKLAGEIETLARLASKQKAVNDYRKHLRRARSLSDGVVIQLPARRLDETRFRGIRQELFVSGIPDLPASLVPNSILGWRSRLELFLSKHPFDRSVFIMIRYRSRNADLMRCVKKALSNEGLFGVLASEHNLTDDLYNPVACLLCCSRGVAVFDKPEETETFNPNVAYELGMLHLLARPCLILKHSSLKSLQTDVLMKLYRPYRRTTEIQQIIRAWCRDPLQTEGPDSVT
jgi:hypothetical protein